MRSGDCKDHFERLKELEGLLQISASYPLNCSLVGTVFLVGEFLEVGDASKIRVAALCFIQKIRVEYVLGTLVTVDTAEQRAILYPQGA